MAEDSSGNEDEKFQKIYDNHIENKTVKYRKIKPLTILITKNIAACKRLTDKLVDFISKKENISKELAKGKVLIVTSANEHKNNILELGRVDFPENPIEWITSVSMLSEGWDVKNVFQIVPHEERAFNSKLLIAQVLGRGLRIPEVYRGEQPIVTVFNHDKWSTNIKHLVDEVLEIEKRIHSYPVEKPEDYHFDLYHIDYDRTYEEGIYPQMDPYELLKKGFISYSTQEEAVEKSTTYVKAVSGEHDEKKTLIELKMYSVEEVAHEVVNKLRIIDMELGTNYSEEFSPEKVKKIIRNSLIKISAKGDLVSEANLQRTLQSFWVVYRKEAKRLRFKIEVKGIIGKNTRKISKGSLGVGALRRDSTVFWDDYSMSLSEEGDKKLLHELDEDDSLPKRAIKKVANKYNFKTPLNVVLASYDPERKFILGLTNEQTAKVIGAWIKSPDIGFYSIDYSWKKGEHNKQGSFNPDFFIKIGGDIIIVEIKMDKDVSDENKAKLRYANEHFVRLNELQKKQKYYFKFLSPESYDLFFKSLREGNYRNFRSELEAKLTL